MKRFYVLFPDLTVAVFLFYYFFLLFWFKSCFVTCFMKSKGESQKFQLHEKNKNKSGRRKHKEVAN